MKHTKTFKPGYYVVKEKGLQHYEIAEYSPEIDCFFLCGDPMPRTVTEIGEVLTRIKPSMYVWPPGNLFWLSMFCFVMSIILNLLHTPCE